jgi:hypothetical protein
VVVWNEWLDPTGAKPMGYDNDDDDDHRDKEKLSNNAVLLEFKIRKSTEKQRGEIVEIIITRGEKRNQQIMFDDDKT